MHNEMGWQSKKAGNSFVFQSSVFDGQLSRNAFVTGDNNQFIVHSEASDNSNDKNSKKNLQRPSDDDQQEASDETTTEPLTRWEFLSGTAFCGARHWRRNTSPYQRNSVLNIIHLFEIIEGDQFLAQPSPLKDPLIRQLGVDTKK